MMTRSKAWDNRAILSDFEDLKEGGGGRSSVEIEWKGGNPIRGGRLPMKGNESRNLQHT